MKSTFDAEVFKAKVNTALERVKTVLDNTRNPQFAADVSHEYSDKFLLAEFLTNSAIAAHLNSLEVLGLQGKILEQLKEWSTTRSVSLRLRAEEKCTFVKKATREVESDTKHVTTSVFGKKESYTVTKITEWFWNFVASWELVAYPGTDVDKAVVLCSHSGTTEIRTTSEHTPKPESVVRPAIDVNISWLLQQFDAKEQKPTFTINRATKSCRTPRRNSEVDAALHFMRSYYTWATSVCSYLTSTLFPVEIDHKLDLSALNRIDGIFVPVLPLFEKRNEVTPYLLEEKVATVSSSSSDKSAVLPNLFSKAFLEEQVRSMAEKLKDNAATFPTGEKIITVEGANVVVVLQHTKRISENYSEGVDYIEDMLWKQVVAAIGKEVSPVDFTNYLAFHNRKFFNSEFQPQLFCYAIRRPDHYPEGTLSIEAQLADGSVASPISTLVSHTTTTKPMYFPINASTNIAFSGDRYLHGWINHQFAGYSGTNLSLVARARQFSSFILLVGRITSADTFEPKHGIIIQNRDDLKIPLMLETIPTPKEFRDAIESLSPEQQRFCKAFRSMQLESTLFGVCVIQIKPQLEKLLKLPDDSLTKEIALTQDLLQLFIKFQIPSDLISYDGDYSAGVAHKIATVKGYVANMQEMIKKSKQSELEEAQQEQQYRKAVAPLPPAAPVLYMAMSAPAPPPTSSLSFFSRAAGPPPPSGGAPPPPAAYAPPPPAPTPTPTPTPKEPKPEKPTEKHETVEGSAAGFGDSVDYTKVPAELDKRFEEYDEDSALRPTIITPAKMWTKKYHKSLLAEQQTSVLEKEALKQERNQAFDLLDALTKSGALTIDQASLHIMVAATHCFAKSIMQTIVQDNINPIDKVENSALIVASTIHRVMPRELIAPEHLPRVTASTPLLLELTKKSANVNK